MYQGVRKDEVHLEGRPVLADLQGPFGNPTADSLRTAVTTTTRAIWMVIFAPASLPAAQMEAHVSQSCEAMATHLAPPGDHVLTEGRVTGITSRTW
jgi:DNA/RNA-binding domain of Phe-tRNA-synthetase-like protein